MVLEKYKKKRDFKKTSEPKAKVKKSKKPIYVIQEHHASHLHWDLRLEFDGVLKSWTVPKKPSKNTKYRRLADQVEDHPIDYAKFEGIIPEGQYGAGKVKIWDKGTFEAISKKPNKIVFKINGKKLKGNYVLVKFRPPKNWLFFKKKDD